MLFWILMALMMLVATLTQASLPVWAVLGYARSPVLLGLVLYYALNHKLWVVVPVAFTAGMLQDGLSMVPLGYSALLFCLVAIVAARYRQLVLSEAAVTAAFFGGIASLVVSLALYLLLRKADLISCKGSVATLHILGSGILGLVTVPVVFLSMAGLHRSLDLIEEEGVDVTA
ncbi:MAG: rod shape-determining protein MreD [Verrucomicrobia bacterium]|jgi:rod shape-determining protein MreD|nr:rod shape-determining protein MreD [Verrucomicrobiota bacterium]